MKRKASPSVLFFVFFTLYAAIGNNKPITISFTFSGRLIIVRATANGRPGPFLLDTGSEGLILNQDQFAPRRNSDGRSIDITGNSQAEHSTCADLVLSGLARKCEPARLADISGLEQAVGHSLLGIIGRHCFRKMEIMFDYQRQVITLFPLDKKGGRLVEPDGRFPLQVISFREKGHLPYVQAEIGRLRLDMVIDCGAEVNLLHHKWGEKAGDHILAERKATLRGVNGEGVEVVNCRIKNIAIEGISYPPMETFLVKELPFNPEYSGPSIDGVLGYAFFRQHRLSINYRKRELSIWEIQGAAIIEEPAIVRE
ncbi:MAG: aspartyl protease family protein [Phaeodactylibacter sp.]|nr:aspartyl protease family protein [Phaeodactylibacter sp.]